MKSNLSPPKIFIFCIIFLSVCINVITIKNGHNWGDDFAQYILHAKNIIEFQPYDSRIMIDHPVVYPPGYPAILAPFLKIFGINFFVFKFLNIIFWYAALFCLYQVSKRYLKDIDSLIILLFLSVSSFYFVFKQNILSDVPFMFFISLALLLFVKYESEEKKVYWFFFLYLLWLHF